MAPGDWAVDVAVMLAAFLFQTGVVLTASSIVIPNLGCAGTWASLNVVPVHDDARGFALTHAAARGGGQFHGPCSCSIAPSRSWGCRARSRASRSRWWALCGGTVHHRLRYCGPPRRQPSPSPWPWRACCSPTLPLARLLAAALASYACRTRAYVAETGSARARAGNSRARGGGRRVEEEARAHRPRGARHHTAHSLSAVSIQAAAAERLIDRDPAAAERPPATARTTAKDALEEIRGMIGVLRAGDPGRDGATAGTEALTTSRPTCAPRRRERGAGCGRVRPRRRYWRSWMWRSAASRARPPRTSCGMPARARQRAPVLRPSERA